MTGKTDPNVAVSWKAWIERAEEDYLLALAALNRKSPLTYGATFHTQQCIEKYMKAREASTGYGVCGMCLYICPHGKKA